MKVRSQTNVISRSGTYYFRKKVPADLKGRFGRSNEIRVSLRTSDRREAERLGRQLAVKWDEEFERARLTMSPTTSQSEIPEGWTKTLSSYLRAHCLEADEEIRRDGMDEEMFARRCAEVEAELKEARASYARGDTSIIKERLAEWLMAFNVDLDLKSPLGKQISRDFLAARIKAMEDMVKRNLGEVVETPELPVLMSSKVNEKEVSLDSLVDHWATERKPTKKTVQMVRAIVKEFVEITRKSNAGKLTKTDIVSFKDALLAKHANAPKSAWKKVTMLAAVLNLAQENERIKENPAKGVKVVLPKNAPKPRVGFTPEDMTAIFSSSIYIAGKRPKGGAGEAAHWIPLIAAYSGMRLDEIGQLLITDVRRDPRTKIWYFDVNNEAGKTLKNLGSVRAVPIHDELIHLGLINYLNTRKNQSNRLFPELTPDSSGVLTGNFSKWFGRHLRETVKIVDTRKVFHSFRHTFKTACRAAGIPKEVHDAITGHSGKDVSDGYGNVSLQTLSEAVQKIKIDGIEIDRFPNSRIAA